MNQERPAPTTCLSAASLSALSVGVLVLNQSGHVLQANPAARRLGLASNEPQTSNATPDRERPHPTVESLAHHVSETGERTEIEIDLPNVRGDASMSIGLRAFLLPEGQIMIEATDVTEAHRLARTRRDFVANVSHELKTPVGALRLLADALLDAARPTPPATRHDVSHDDGPSTDSEGQAQTEPARAAQQASTPADPGFADPAAIRRFANRIRHESSRLGRLVTELLELSRLLGAEPLPTLNPVSVDRIVAEVLDRARTTASDKNTSLRYTGPRGLVVYGNEPQLVTAVANLVDNSIAYSPPDTTVTITTGADSGHITIAITDEGIGIEDKHLDRIFERFYRVDKARSRDTGGTGLGLAIVKHITTNHAGRVEVASTVGQGSTFTLRLPAQPVETAASPRPRPARQAPAELPRAAHTDSG